jgi:hypothetical protein
MNNNQITAIIIAMLNSRYIIPGNDNEKTAKEIVKVYNILKEKTYDEENCNDEQFNPAQYGN